MTEKKKTLYRTSDIYFAAYLCSIEIEMVNTEEEQGADGGRKLVFVFKVPEADLQRMKSSYFGGQATVKVRNFVDNLKALKALVYI